MFPSNFYADCFLPQSNITDPPSSFDWFLGGNDPENELHLLTQTFDVSSFDHSPVSPVRTPLTDMIFHSIEDNMADGIGGLLSFPNHVGAAVVGHDTDYPHHPSRNNEMNFENVFVAGENPKIRKRSGKKDRHSKIVTAQGTRDRRMRLSLDIARKFFDLQDKLGYDKASKTVEWLMGQSKEAIREVMQGILQPERGNNLSAAYISDFEDISGVEECTPIDYNEESGADLNEQNYRSEPPPITTSPKSTKNKAQMRKPTFILPHGKESRAMARARARERTKEKQSRKMAIDHEKNTATTSRYQYPQIQQQRADHFDIHHEQIVSLIGAMNNRPDVVFNCFLHQDWSSHGGIR